MLEGRPSELSAAAINRTWCPLIFSEFFSTYTSML